MSAAISFRLLKTNQISHSSTLRGQRYANFGDGMAATSGASVAEMLKRFKVTAAIENSQFVLSKLDDGGGLLKLNKDS